MALIPYFKDDLIILDNESDRNLSWGQGTRMFCRDTGKYYLIDEGVFKLFSSGDGDLHVDQTTPQKVINGAPQFDAGLSVSEDQWVYLDGL
jgi:hypothetical protein